MALSKAEGLRYPHPSSLRRTSMYASFLGISEALHMGIFHQPLRTRFFDTLVVYLSPMKLTIFKRLTFGYMAILVLVIVLGIYVTVKLRELNHITGSIASVDGTTISISERLLDRILSQVGFEKKYFVSKDPDFYKRTQEITNQVADDLEQLDNVVDTDKKHALIAQIRSSYTQYLILLDKEAAIVNKGQEEFQKEYQAGRDKMVEEINENLRAIIRIAQSDRDKKTELSNQISSRVLKITALTAGMVIFIGLLISFFNTRNITRSVALLKKRTKEIAEGKFEETSNISSPPEIKELADDFNAMSGRLKELDEMKLDFISHVSHELRTPLTAIKEASGMLLDGTYSKVPEKRHELLTITKQECERLIESVNRILDLSRMEADMMDYQFRRCSLIPVIQKTILKLAPIAQRKKIYLELKPSPDLPPVIVDEERIGQVIENLVANALKFTSAKGRIIVSTHLLNLKKNKKNALLFAVQDTGHGITKENLEKIFHKFKRIEDGKQTARGTGLGLSIAKYIITAHGGKIWARSEPGKGSIFFFALPVR
jgi:two-component system sensor histidine kinase GlrK